ncbi:MAG: hypothetical protein U1E26_03950 [Coriobacteriia bacterium]|nr:hypothetical protein [Coriobacteriia bacterium]
MEVVLLLLVPVLLPAILMHGRKSARFWYVLSAVGVVLELIVVVLVSQNPFPAAENSWAILFYGILIFGLVTVPIGILGIGMLVDRIVERLLLVLRRSRFRVGATTDRDHPPDGGESQAAGAVLASRSARREKAIRAVAVVVVVGIVGSLIYGEILRPF